MNKPYRIFYTDDDADDQDLFHEIVKGLNMGHTVSSHFNGMELMNSLKNNGNTPHLVFLDLNMPFKNGFEVLEEIRMDEKLKHLPVIIFSTSDNPQNIAICKNLGATGYLRKPTSYPEMKSMIRTILEMCWHNDQTSKNEFFHLTKS